MHIPVFTYTLAALYTVDLLSNGQASVKHRVTTGELLLVKNQGIKMDNLSNEEYWKLLGRVIISSDISAFAACLGWIIYWLDHIPNHVIHLHWFSPFLFLASLSAALYAAVIIMKTGNRLGARRDRILHIFEITYAFFASVSGIAASFLNPPF